MALFAFSKQLNPNNYSDDSFAVDMFLVASDTIGVAYEQVTSLGANLTTSRIYTRTYTISTTNLSSQVDVSGAGTYGFFTPSICTNAAGTIQLISYSAGSTLNPNQGFVVKESADSGATWANSYSGGGSYANDANNGLFKDTVTGDVYLVTSSSRVGGYKVNVHKRTGAGTWSVVTANTGTATSSYILDGTPQQQAVFVNGKALIVGCKSDGSIWALYSTDQVTWSEVMITGAGNGSKRAVKLTRSTDGIIRVMLQGLSAGGVLQPPSIYFSNDMGHTWTSIGIPPGLFGEDENGQIVGWPDSDLMSFSLDGRGRMFIVFGDSNNPTLQTYRAWSTAYTSWKLLASDSISDGSSHVYNPSDQSKLPCPALIVGVDIFRVVCSWVASANATQAWMLKAAGGAIAAGGRTGGGGSPRKYTED